jgi:hypothetical protein
MERRDGGIGGSPLFFPGLVAQRDPTARFSRTLLRVSSDDGHLVPIKSFFRKDSVFLLGNIR